MGCDGGTIPTRGEQVKTKKKPEKVSKEAELLTKWMHCAMSQEPLKQPIVACQLGNLYNKESVIMFLLDKSSKSSDAAGKSKLADKFEHIRSRKDVKDLQLSDNPAFSSDDPATKGGRNLGASAFICEVTGLEMNGHYRFCYILTCGCVVSERAINEIGDNGSCCIRCGGKFVKDDVIALNPVFDELERLRVKMEERRVSALKDRKAKKSKGTALPSDSLAAATVSDSSSSSTVSDASTPPPTSPDRTPPGILTIKSEPVELESLQTESEGCPPPGKKQKLTEGGPDESAVRKSTTPPVGEQDIKPKLENLKHKKASRSDGGSAGTASGVQIGIGLAARAKIAYGGDKSKKPTIQNDSSTTAVYKSLFNTHANAINQPKAHWVTYNPQYFN